MEIAGNEFDCPETRLRVESFPRYPVLRRGYEPRIAQWSRKDSRYGRIALPTLPVRSHFMMTQHTDNGGQARVNQGLNRYEPAPAFTYRPRNRGLFGSWWQSRPNQGLWVGSPPPYLPPDGDYPGGSTGIPMVRNYEGGFRIFLSLRYMSK